MNALDAVGMLGQEGAVSLGEEGLGGLSELREVEQRLRLGDGTDVYPKVLLKGGGVEGGGVMGYTRLVTEA